MAIACEDVCFAMFCGWGVHGFSTVCAAPSGNLFHTEKYNRRKSIDATIIFTYPRDFRIVVYPMFYFTIVLIVIYSHCYVVVISTLAWFIRGGAHISPSIFLVQRFSLNTIHCHLYLSNTFPSHHLGYICHYLHICDHRNRGHISP